MGAPAAFTRDALGCRCQTLLREAAGTCGNGWRWIASVVKRNTIQWQAHSEFGPTELPNSFWITDRTRFV
jgi:hypothetical protein